MVVSLTSSETNLADLLMEGRLRIHADLEKMTLDVEGVDRLTIRAQQYNEDIRAVLLSEEISYNVKDADRLPMKIGHLNERIQAILIWQGLNNPGLSDATDSTFSEKVKEVHR